MKFPIKDFLSKCDLIPRKLWIWSHLLKKSFMENFIFCELYFFSSNVLIYILQMSNDGSNEPKTSVDTPCKRGGLSRGNMAPGKQAHECQRGEKQILIFNDAGKTQQISYTFQITQLAFYFSKSTMKIIENNGNKLQKWADSSPANISCFPRRLQDVLKTSSA